MTDSAQDSHRKDANDQAKAKAVKKEDQQTRSGKDISLSNFLIFVFGSVGLVFIGLAINYHTKGGYDATKLALLWGIIGYGLFGVGLYFAYFEYVVKPVRSADREAAAQKSKVSIEAPELFIERTRIDPLAPDTPVTFRLDIKNRGKVTASKIRIVTMHALLKADKSKGPLHYKAHPAMRLAAVAPDASVSIVSASTWKITDEQIADIKAGRSLLFHYGKGSYQGDGDKELVFDFCSMFEPSVGAVVGCAEQYWPKDEDPELISQSASRAFVIVQSADLTVFEIGKKTEALITFVNSGRVPATNVRVYGHIQLRDKPLAPDMPGAKDIGEEPSQDIMPANGGSVLMPIISGLELTPNLMGLIDKGTHRIYVWGIVTYEDMMGKHWTKFCMIQYRKSLKVEMCTNNNETD